MSRLKNRNQMIPNGFSFLQPETGFKPPSWMSFDAMVKAILDHRRGNPYLAAKHKWNTEYNAIADELDRFNAAVCERHGWTDYIMAPAADPPLPKFKALSPVSEKQLHVVADKIKKVWQGVRSLNDWLDSGIPPVEPALAQKRAEVCVACPLNGKGGLEEWFTKPASEIIKRQFAKAAERKLATSVDDKLNVCVACLCPLKLLAHVPLEFKLAHMGPETRKALDPNCWITAEERARSYS